jgi:hypothetical protein
MCSCPRKDKKRLALTKHHLPLTLANFQLRDPIKQFFSIGVTVSSRLQAA